MHLQLKRPSCPPPASLPSRRLNARPSAPNSVYRQALDAAVRPSNMSSLSTRYVEMWGPGTADALPSSVARGHDPRRVPAGRAGVRPAPPTSSSAASPVLLAS